MTHEPTREYGIEIDPRFADARTTCAGWPQLGFNRLSVGIQDFDPAVQQAINRVQSVEQTGRGAAGGARRRLRLGQRGPDLWPAAADPGRLRADAWTEVIALAPDRVAVYGYAHLPALFKAQRQIHDERAARLRPPGWRCSDGRWSGCVRPATSTSAWTISPAPTTNWRRAQRAGTLQRNFQGYSTHGDCDIVGLGVSAIGRIGDCYSQNARDLPGYYAALDAGQLPVARGL